MFYWFYQNSTKLLHCLFFFSLLGETEMFEYCESSLLSCIYRSSRFTERNWCLIQSFNYVYWWILSLVKTCFPSCSTILLISEDLSTVLPGQSRIFISSFSLFRLRLSWRKTSFIQTCPSVRRMLTTIFLSKIYLCSLKTL